MGSPEASPSGSAGGADDAAMPPPSPAADAFPPPSPAADAFPPPSPAPAGPATLAKLSVSKLKSLARYHGVNIAGCLEKAEMVGALRKAGIDDAAAEKAMNAGQPAKPPEAK